MAFMWEQGLRSELNSLEPGSHILAKKAAYLFDTDFRTIYQALCWLFIQKKNMGYFLSHLIKN